MSSELQADSVIRIKLGGQRSSYFAHSRGVNHTVKGRQWKIVCKDGHKNPVLVHAFLQYDFAISSRKKQSVFHLPLNLSWPWLLLSQ